MVFIFMTHTTANCQNLSTDILMFAVYMIFDRLIVKRLIITKTTAIMTNIFVYGSHVVF